MLYALLYNDYQRMYCIAVTADCSHMYCFALFVDCFGGVIMFVPLISKL
jgi:hypothetical protein